MKIFAASVNNLEFGRITEYFEERASSRFDHWSGSLKDNPQAKFNVGDIKEISTLKKWPQVSWEPIEPTKIIWGSMLEADFTKELLEIFSPKYRAEKEEEFKEYKTWLYYFE